MGGYGGSSGKVKADCYYDTGGNKVRDPNAIAVGEYYISKGKYVAFLQEKPPRKRADLSIDGMHTEVKGMTSTKTNKIANTIKGAFEQVYADNDRYPIDSHRIGKVIILSKHNSAREAYKAVSGGFRTAKKKGYVTGKVELWYKGKIVTLN